MSQICLENIVTVRNYCDTAINQTSSSGYDLMDAPEINLSKINDMANAEFTTGYKLLKNCVRLALRDINVDFIKVLHANKITAISKSIDISTGRFTEANTNNAVNAKGIVIHQNDSRGIRRIKIKKLRIYPVNDHPEAQIRFIDNGKESIIKVQLVGGRVNEFATDYFVEGSDVKILMKGVETYSSQLTCLVGCNGSKPNQCGYVKGWNGYQETKEEGFGINAVFSCECDFSQILCQQSKSFVGVLIWLKSRINVLEERISSARLNPFIIYGQEDAKRQRLELINEYNENWNVFIDTVPNLIGSDDCFSCNKARVVVNV